MRITIAKIAELAGVSKATVSRVLNNSGYVAEKTRRKVMKIIEEFNFVPDSRAVNLSKSMTRTIGLVIPTTSGPFYMEVIRGIEDVLAANGYYMLLMTFEASRDKNETRKKYRSLLDEKRVDGLIVFDPEADESFVQEMANAKKPCVYLGREYPKVPIDTVSADNFTGSRLMMLHLLEHHGFRKIAFVRGPLDSYHGLERLKGYRKTLREFGIGYDENLVFCGNFTREGAEKIAKKIFAVNPEAIFASNDEMALGIIHKAKQLKIPLSKIPIIVGFDDAPWAEHINPALTTVKQPMYDIGKTAARIMMDRLSGDRSKVPMKVKLHTSIVIRESCGCLKAAFE
ncbi:LacI family DNA-binding transcriptional regulator [Kosmotoga pacifica]|uniref:LacI family DNA-binding transcriptional regulator n=1 Tax=Kosmotoga pacifica TaxID=1330330 RepID=UPI0006994514|nr:LacI family DNA-binding transcriptional regulator [Kosmotoga pacifica]